LTGVNPILIVTDHPPLGRYIIALSILLFDNEVTIPAILNIVSLIALLLVSRLVIKNKYLAVIPVAIFASQQLFITKLYTLPLGEPIQLPFILLSLYFFMKSIQSKKYIFWYILTSLFIGAVISIRFFVLGAALAGALILYLLLKKQIKRAAILIATFPLSLGVLLASYFETFLAGYSLKKVLGIQKYILVYHKSAFTNPLSYWDLLLFNKWHTWWGNYAISSDPQWSILWPVSIFMVLGYFALVIWKKLKISEYELVLLLWLGCYSLVLSVGYTSTRYFLPIVSLLYILAASFVIKASLYFKKYFKNSHRWKVFGISSVSKPALRYVTKPKSKPKQ